MNEIFQKSVVIEDDEDFKNLIVAMLAAYPAYRRLRKFCKKEFNKDLSADDFYFRTPPIAPIETYPFAKALEKFFEIAPDLKGYPLFYELAEKAFSLEKELYKGME